jgi:hypothetical protein
MNVSMVYGGPTHIKLVCEWEPETKAAVFGVIPDQHPEPHESVTELRQYYEQPLQTSLTDSLNIYTREETVSCCGVHTSLVSSSFPRRLPLFTLSASVYLVGGYIQEHVTCV